MDPLVAHPVAVLAIPAFIPVVGVVATVLWVARKDRLAERAEQEHGPAEVAEAPAAEDPRRSWRDRMPRLVIGDED